MLRLLPGQPLPVARSPYESQVIQFCQQWLAGQKTVTLSTSGSTGKPKPIELSRNQLTASARMTGATFGLLPGDHAFCGLNVAYIAGIMMLVRALELGLSLTVVEPSAYPLKGIDPQEKLDFAAFVPLQLQTMLEQHVGAIAILDRMKAILVGGATLSGALEKVLQRLTAPVFSTYGMTETVSHVAIRRLNGAERTENYQLLGGVEAGSDHRSCLWVRGAMTDFNVVQTNDVVAWTSARSFEWRGRYDNIINSGGVKVQPERVELAVEIALRDVGFTGRFFVTGLAEERLGQQVALVLEGSPLMPTQQVRADELLREHVPAYELPRRWIAVTHFVETPTGKVDKRRTLEKWSEAAD